MVIIHNRYGAWVEGDDESKREKKRREENKGEYLCFSSTTSNDKCPPKQSKSEGSEYIGFEDPDSCIVRKISDDSGNSDNSDNSIGEQIVAYVGMAIRSFAKLRYLTYSSEVGEATRSVTNKNIVKVAYCISFGYVFSDIGLKLHSIKDVDRETFKYTAADLSLWHASASIVLPTAVIHTTVKATHKIQSRIPHTYPRFMKNKFAPVFMGLAIIPAIIHPIDNFTDFVMDNTIRTLYPVKVRDFHHFHH